MKAEIILLSCFVIGIMIFILYLKWYTKDKDWGKKEKEVWNK